MSFGGLYAATGELGDVGELRMFSASTGPLYTSCELGFVFGMRIP